jgi:hypothetical protein
MKTLSLKGIQRGNALKKQKLQELQIKNLKMTDGK